MDLHKLRIFVEVARTGGFTRAAELLHLTQPTVSQQLAALEAQVGAPLIERQARRQRLTPAGAALLPYAERLLALTDEALEAARAAAGVADRTLRLGVGHTLATYLLPGLLRRYRAAHPGRLVRISVGNTAELLEQVAAGAVELALVGSPAEHAGVAVTPFMHDRLAVIVAPEDEWAGREAVELEELRARTLLTREPGSALHASVARLLGPAALAGERVILLGETEAIKRSVEAGLGVALVQAIAVEREVAAGTLRALALHGGDDTRTYNVAHAQGRELSSAARALLHLLFHHEGTKAPG
ncbi:MAG TPA: LysR substrate-binding domain-containing protein [Roseiflexaceae bacterium]|nr:LysR substrate-binding domain-containing protein [Roseiflexaceae bacterium]